MIKKSSEVSASTETNNAIIFNPSQASNEHHISLSWTHHEDILETNLDFILGTLATFLLTTNTFIRVHPHIPVNKNCFETINGNFSITSHYTTIWNLDPPKFTNLASYLKSLHNETKG